MKKRDLVGMAMMGMALAFLPGCNKATGDEKDSEMKTFYEQLTPDAQAKFNQLDDKHKKAALKINEQACKGEAQCKGHREQAVEEQYKLQMQERGKASSEMKGS